jgi:hypothetical protein
MVTTYSSSFIKAVDDSGVSGKSFGRRLSPFTIAEKALGRDFASKTRRELALRERPVSDRLITGWSHILSIDCSVLRAILAPDYSFDRGSKVDADREKIARADEELRKSLMGGKPLKSNADASVTAKGRVASHPVLRSDATNRSRPDAR